MESLWIKGAFNFLWSRNRPVLIASLYMFYSKTLRCDTSVLVGCDGGNFGVKIEENIWRGEGVKYHVFLCPNWSCNTREGDQTLTFTTPCCRLASLRLCISSLEPTVAKVRGRVHISYLIYEIYILYNIF